MTLSTSSSCTQLLSFALIKTRLQPIAVTNASIGKHVLLKASIEPVAGEEDTADNTMTVEVEVKGAFQTMIVAPRVALHEERLQKLHASLTIFKGFIRLYTIPNTIEPDKYP